MKISEENKKLRLETVPIRKLLWEYSLPAITGMVVMSLYNVVDRIFIGLGVGALAISGLALTFPFMNVMVAFSVLVGIGASARLSIRLGENDIQKAEKILGNAFTLTLIVSSFVITLSILFLRKILVLFGGSENTLSYAVEYMQIILPGSIFSALTFNFNNIMRASGFPMKAMYTMIISSLINIILDALFLFVFDWGIKGVAYATVVSYFISSLWVMYHFLGRDRLIRFKRNCFKLQKDIVKSILNIGISPFTMQISASLVVVLLNVQLIKYGGDLAVGALGIETGVTSFVIMIIIGINQGSQPILGYSYGAKNYTRMFETLRKTIFGATVVATIGFVLIFFFPEYLIRLFTTDEDLKKISITALKFSVLIYPLVGSQIIMTNFFQSIGKAKISMLLSLTRQIFFLIPFLLILPYFYQLNGVWASLPASDVFAVIVTTGTFTIFIKKFKKQMSLNNK